MKCYYCDHLASEHYNFGDGPCLKCDCIYFETESVESRIEMSDVNELKNEVMILMIQSMENKNHDR